MLNTYSIDLTQAARLRFGSREPTWLPRVAEAMRAALAADTPARSQPSSLAAPRAGTSTPAAAATAATGTAGLASTVAALSSGDSAPASGDAEVSKQVSRSKCVTRHTRHAIHLARYTQFRDVRVHY